MTDYSHLLEPIRIQGVRFKNRIFAAPTQIRQKNYHGSPNDYGIEYYEAKARGGAAVVCVGDTPVEPLYGASQFNSFYLSDPGSLTALSETAAAIKQYGALASLELSHGGMMADPAFNEGREPIGPSDFVRPMDGVHVHAMDQSMIDYIVESFSKGAGILKRCGFDMATIHCGHSTLLEQFLSPRSNHRTDEYGGSLENRFRFPLMVIDAVRKAIGKSMLLEVRISGDEFAQGGFTLDDMIAFSKQLVGRVDLIHVSAGVQNAPTGLVRLFPSNVVPSGCNVYLAEAIRKATGLPTVAVGGINTPELAEEILADGKADFVALGRALIADPEFANKIRDGKRPTPCMRCLNCLAGMNVNRHLTCTVNPVVGSEHRMKPVAPSEPKKVLVIGGGPGGIKAAATAAKRGHTVLLCEAGSQLGGHTCHADFDDRKLDLKRVKDSLIAELEESGAEVRLNTRVDGVYIREWKPDAVIAAVGSYPVKPPVPGMDRSNVISALSIYDTIETIGDNVVIVGGGFVGCEAALYLADQGKKVVVLEMLDALDKEDAPLRRMALMMEMNKCGIQGKTGYACTRITEEGVWAKGSDGEETLFAADTVLTATGLRADTALVDELNQYCDRFYPIGDCQKPRKVTDAIREGYFTALYL